MAEWTSALRGHLSPGRFEFDGAISLTLSEVSTFCLTQISAWPERLEQTGEKAARLAGCDTAPVPGRCVGGLNGTLIRVEPLKWWLIGREAPTQRPEIAPEDGAALDLSSSRTWIRLSGPDATGFLNRFLPLDLSDKAFPPNTCASSDIHHIGVTLWRDQESFNLLLPRSFAASLWELLSESAAQFGVEVA